MLFYTRSSEEFNRPVICCTKWLINTGETHTMNDLTKTIYQDFFSLFPLFPNICKSIELAKPEIVIKTLRL